MDSRMDNMQYKDATVRLLAIYLLSEDNGMSHMAFLHLEPLLVKDGHNDILESIDVRWQRHYLSKENAEMLVEK